MQLATEFNASLDKRFFYHFTTDIGLRAIQGESPRTIIDSLGKDIPIEDKKGLLKSLQAMTAKGTGLHPANWLVQPRLATWLLPLKGRLKVIEGVLQPAPATWIETRDMPEKGMSFYNFFISFLTNPNAGLTKKYAKEYKLLKIAVCPEDDVHVADAAAMIRDTTPVWQSFQEGKRKKLSFAYNFSVAIGKGARRYWKSLTPLSAYAANDAGTLPTVVCWTSIPPERISVVQSFSRDDMKELAALQPGFKL